MARPIEQNLYQSLIETNFDFIERGEHRITEIYEKVHDRFPELCDDGYACPHLPGTTQTEWTHTVRRAIQCCKSKGEPIRTAQRRGYWVFF